ncbi:hypothetical protein HDU85_004953 [Gaertneriomyces sp. JEL0708]|nr:hypothetical protein HDU85_004953 [Gaertneriomyces sp. JEL0708]
MSAICLLPPHYFHRIDTANVQGESYLSSHPNTKSPSTSTSTIMNTPRQPLLPSEQLLETARHNAAFSRTTRNPPRKPKRRQRRPYPRAHALHYGKPPPGNPGKTLRSNSHRRPSQRPAAPIVALPMAPMSQPALPLDINAPLDAGSAGYGGMEVTSQSGNGANVATVSSVKCPHPKRVSPSPSKRISQRSRTQKQQRRLHKKQMQLHREQFSGLPAVYGRRIPRRKYRDSYRPDPTSRPLYTPAPVFTIPLPIAPTTALVSTAPPEPAAQETSTESTTKEPDEVDKLLDDAFAELDLELSPATDDSESDDSESDGSCTPPLSQWQYPTTPYVHDSSRFSGLGGSTTDGTFIGNPLSTNVLGNFDGLV